MIVTQIYSTVEKCTLLKSSVVKDIFFLSVSTEVTWNKFSLLLKTVQSNSKQYLKKICFIRFAHNVKIKKKVQIEK